MDRDQRVDTHEAIERMLTRIIVDAAAMIEKTAEQQVKFQKTMNISMTEVNQIATVIRDTADRADMLTQRLIKAYRDMQDDLPY